jgi:hypothetical protein
MAYSDGLDDPAPVVHRVENAVGPDSYTVLCGSAQFLGPPWSGLEFKAENA